MSNRDRMLEPFSAIVDALTARFLYMGWYSATVISQNADGTLELQPEDTRLPGLSAVRIMTGVAGVEVDVPAGATVLVSFANADPSRPFAALWGSGNATIRFNGGTAKVARNGDPVKVTLTPADIAGISLTWPGGVSVLPVDASVDVTGTITDGAPNVKA